MIHLGLVAAARGGSAMPCDDPACFHLDRIPVRPIHWRGRPYLPCSYLASPDGAAGAGNLPLAARALRPDAKASQAAPWRPPGVYGRAANLSGYGRIRPCRTTPVGADEGKADRPPSRSAAALRPYGLGRRRIRSGDRTNRDGDYGPGLSIFTVFDSCRFDPAPCGWH